MNKILTLIRLLLLIGIGSSQYPYSWDNTYNNPYYGWTSYPYYNTGYYQIYDNWGYYYGSSYYNNPYWTYYNGNQYSYGWLNYNPYSGYYPY